MTSTHTHPPNDEKGKMTQDHQLANLATCFNTFKHNILDFSHPTKLREMGLTCCVLKQETARHLEEPGLGLGGANSGCVRSSSWWVFWGGPDQHGRDSDATGLQPGFHGELCVPWMPGLWEALIKSDLGASWLEAALLLWNLLRVMFMSNGSCFLGAERRNIFRTKLNLALKSSIILDYPSNL